MKTKDTRPQGQIRQSQIITTFGPGAMVDLPKYAVVIGGLEHWKGRGPEIFEERLVDKIKQALELSAVRLYAPPPDSGEPGAPMSGITAWQFPEWFIGTGDEERGESYRSPAADPSAAARQRQIPRERPAQVRSPAGPICPGVPQRPSERPGLVRVRP